MKVTVWQGCKIVHELELNATGPDVHMDPFNLPGQVGFREGGEHRFSVDPKIPALGLATTKELIDELAARAEVSEVAGDQWPHYRTVDSE